jgi:roadblock/LC7 domain-containing protein
MRHSFLHRCAAIALSSLLVAHFPSLAQAQVAKVNAPLAATGDVADYRFSPDGKFIVYIADPTTDNVTQVFSAPTAGGAPTPLSSNVIASGISNLAISPDSRHALYLMSDSVRNDVYSVPISGGVSLKLSAGMQVSGSVSSFAVSPDGSSVVYLADRETDGVNELFRVPVGGGAPVKLNPPLAVGRSVGQFAYSPNGSHVVYIADQNTDDVFELFAVPAAGGAAVRLSGNQVLEGDVQSFEIAPNSARVVYQADQRTDGVIELFSALIAGGGVANLNVTMVAGGGIGCRGVPFIFGSIIIMRYKISPDSTRVVYCADQSINDDIELFSVPIDGAAPPVKISGPLAPQGDVLTFDFNGSGSQVIYRADQISDTVDDLFAVPVGGGSIQRLSGPFPPDSRGVLEFRVAKSVDRVAFVAAQAVSSTAELFESPLAAGSARRVHPPIASGTGVIQSFLSIFGGNTISFAQNDKRVVYAANAIGDGTVRAYSAPLLQAGAVVTLNGPLVISGNVFGVIANPVDNTVLYLADQDTDEIAELYKSADVKVAGGPVFLPAALRQSGTEIEPNDNAATATPIIIGSGLTRVQGKFDNEYDVFRVELASPGPLRLALSGLSAAQLANRTVQLQLYAGSVSAGTLVPAPAQPPHVIDHNAAAGTYYIVVYSNPTALEPATTYELTVGR